MANSVSKINVVVGANTSQLTAGMNQAAATVGRGMGNVQQVAQAATFAVDDFFAAFSTGGVAGGLRGAGNNLTQIASMLGGIKTQLAVIGALAVGQFIAKSFSKGKNEIEAATDALALYREELQRVSGRIGRASEFRGQLQSLGGIRTVAEARQRQQEGQFASRNIEQQRQQNENRIEELRAELDKEKKWKRSSMRKEGLNASETDAEIDARIKVIAEEIAEREKVGRQLKDELEDQRRINGEVDKRLRLFLRAKRVQGPQFDPLGISSATRSRMGKQIQDIDAEIASLREGMRPKLSMADMFRLLPGANAMGSSGAIGSINAAIAGPQNARDAGPALQRETNNILKRIEDLEKKKKGLVEVIGL